MPHVGAAWGCVVSRYTLPAPDAPAEEWGRLAVSIPGFTWTMPWASLPDDMGRVWRRNWCPSDSGFGWTQVCGPRTRGRRPTFDAINPDDPATAGCLLALLGPGAWDNVAPGSAIAPDGEDWWAWVDGDYRPGWSEGMTLGRACIAAAKALGRWPGGEG